MTQNFMRFVTVAKDTNQIETRVASAKDFVHSLGHVSEHPNFDRHLRKYRLGSCPFNRDFGVCIPSERKLEAPIFTWIGASSNDLEGLD